MALNYTKRRTETVEFDGGENSITVRGLNVPDIVQLVDVHRDTAQSIYQRFTGKNAEKLNDTTVEEIAVEVIGTFPAAVAHILALAGDEPERMAEYATLPIDVQISALEKIATLTFAMEGGVKNFVETVARIVASAGGLSKNLTSKKTLMNGSEASASA